MDLGKLFFCGFDDFNEEAKEIIRKYRPAGILIYPGLLSREYLFFDFMNFLSKEGKFIMSSDHEGGQLEVLKYVPSFPGNLAAGKLDPIYTGRYCEMAGRIMNTLGFNMVFAPVLDLLSEKSSAVVDLRSFGSDPEKVASHGLEACRGYLRGGVIPCVKHFPGHGKTTDDSHYLLPTVNATFEELWNEDILPFRKVFQSGVKTAVMTAHVKYTAVDDLPATLSKKMITEILRERLNFKGLVLSDAMEMKAISENFSIEETVKLFIEAGGNMILLDNFRDLPAYYEALKRLVKDGKIEKEKMERSIKIVGDYLNTIENRFNAGLSTEVAERAIEYTRVSKELLDVEVVLLVPSNKNLSPADTTGGDYDLIPEIARRFFKIKDVIRYDIETGPDNVDGELIFDFVVNASKNDRALKAHLNLPSDRTIYFIVRNPFDAKFFTGRNAVITYSTKPISVYKSFEHLLGRCSS
ncbi:glycoside hydrolase family 3 N-terminal domain-containing protein [Thermotoga sp. SG1]|uniref:glycoside hydrolase family 3 N-terminal domain-containing protein n=1 Tax=Thermotoga sp. SG1 TaxID=126739 RepID=UPI000CAC0BC2|nr:glycoside hydrolase family 3 N-terminal domain-containing protein [Thermotoga sp. SG1]PLV57045.1 hydrolase [Thermotoga sp. SG1]